MLVHKGTQELYTKRLKLTAKHDIDNPASGKVMLKCNMTYEGKLREHYLRHDGAYSDSLVYGILKNEFTYTL